MKIIYSGGFDKYSEASEKASVLYAFSADIDSAYQASKKIAFVTLAKPDGYYDERLNKKYGNKITIINSENIADTDWSAYSIIILLGGDTLRLHSGLKKGLFSPDKLRADCLLIGDSAGAYVLSAWYFDCGDDLRNNLTFYEGLFPETKLIAIAHTNNPRYTNEELIAKVKDFAVSKSLNVQYLKENERKELAIESI